MAISFRLGSVHEQTHQYVFVPGYGSGTVDVGTVYENYHNYSIAVEISGLAKQDYRIGFVVSGAYSNAGYAYPREINASDIVDGKYVIQGGLGLQVLTDEYLYAGYVMTHYVGVYCSVSDKNGNELGSISNSFYIKATLQHRESTGPDPEPDPEPDPIPIPEPEPEPIKPIKTLDLGRRHKPFGVRYVVSDPDLQQTLTVTEKLNDKVIRTINNFNRNDHGTVKITSELFTPLQRDVKNTIEVSVTDGIASDSYFMTFIKDNSAPIIKYNGGTDLGGLDNPPAIKYSVSDPDKDKVTVTEKLNGRQIRSFEATLNREYTVSIPFDFWRQCTTNKNTVEIIAEDTYKARDKKTITFAKNEPKTAYTVYYAIEGDIRYEKFFISAEGIEEKEPRGYTFARTTYDTNMDYSLNNLADGTKIRIWMVAHNNYASEKYKSSNILEFTKMEYGKPIPEVTLTQYHSEHGDLELTYNHENLKCENGTWISEDPDRKPSDFIGKVEIHCYVDGKYSRMYPLSDNIIRGGETKKYTINFNEISPGSRSHKIEYFVVITDTESGVKNSNIQPGLYNPSVNNSFGSHYYNDEPNDPIISYKDSKYSNNVMEYEFTHIDITWNDTKDPDGDQCIYYVYLKAPESLNEQILSTDIPSRRGPNTIQYTRKYKITERHNESNEVIGCYVDYYNNDAYERIQTNDYVGIHIDYLKDHLGKYWPENERYTIAVEAKDNRKTINDKGEEIDWGNSYYGLFDSETSRIEFYRRKHAFPHEVQLTVIPNLVDGLGDGEKGRITVMYDHPEITDKEGTVDIYAYQDNKLICRVYSGQFYPKQEQTLTIDFTMYEHKLSNEIQRSVLKRSKDIYYYAVATDILDYSSFDKYQDIGLEHVPYLVPNEDGTYNSFTVNVNGITYDYNVDNHYMGPVQKGRHYFNEEPPGVTPEEVNPNIVGYESVSIKWPHVTDPDGDEVKYEIYVANSVSALNSEEKEFFNDNQVDENDYVDDLENTHTLVSTRLKYHKVIDIPASVAEESSKGFDISIKEYIEDSSVNIWMVSKDPYVNSYYRAGEIINVPKGHEGKAINIAYPRNGSTVYAKQPRILIYLGEDNLEQTTYIQWKEHTYNNRDNPELFSNPPNIKNVTVFKPPEVYTGVSGGKVTFSVWVHNKCTYGPKTYVTYTYRDFFESFTEDKLIPIKSSHVNSFRQAINTTRDAYGLDQYEFSRKIEKNMIFENFDFNETKKAIMDVNDKINNADSSDGLDYVNPLIVDVDDLDLIEYQGSIAAGSYEEFMEWARLVYILENL